jgi:NADH-quinone oxidoreductase subunit M
MNILSIIIFAPLVLSAFVVLAKTEKQAKITAVFVSAFSFAWSLVLPVKFNQAEIANQFIEKYNWIESFNIKYFLAIDGLAMLLLLMTNFICFSIILYSDYKRYRNKVFFTCLLATQGLASGIFCAKDAMLFYLFFETILIPIFILIGVWGGKNKIYATYKFFIYTIFGSLLLLIAFLYMYKVFGSFDILYWQQHAVEELTSLEQKWLFVALFIAFAIKTPMVPLHSWLPDVHVQAPSAGSVVLASILLKVGAVAMLLFIVPVLPVAYLYFGQFVVVLSVVAILYASLIAFSQTDLKKMIAYSSISHMGFVTLAIFSTNEIAMKGAILQMLCHGFVVAGLFLSVGMIQRRLGTRTISELGSLALLMPKFATLFMFFTLAAIGIPLTGNFVAEITILIGAFSLFPILTALASLGIVLTTIYMLNTYRKVFFLPIKNKNIEKITDLDYFELGALVPLVIFVLILGLQPNIVFNLL